MHGPAVSYIEILSDFIIQTLKEFSSSGMKVTSEALSHALASREEMLRAAIRGAMRNFPQSSLPDQTEEAVLLPRLKPSKNGEALPQTFLSDQLPRFQSLLLGLLAELAPISKEEQLRQASELRRRLTECRSLDSLLSHGDDLLQIFRVFVGQATEEIERTRGFLDDLGKDLTGVEQQILSYDGIHRQTYLSNGAFGGELLSQTSQMAAALSSGQNLRQTIMERLAMIKSAVAAKQKEDESRLIEADKKLFQLQQSIQIHKMEIEQVKQRAEELEREVMLDSLTGIYNRRAYSLRVREEIRRFHRYGQTFSLVLIDVDDFKQINDRYGHRTGDKCLREIAVRIRSSLRGSDFFARYGGEEFVAVLAGTAKEDARIVAEKIRSVIERTRFKYQDAEIPVTISLGVTEIMSTDEGIETVFERADDAMYQSKQNGRNRVTMA